MKNNVKSNWLKRILSMIFAAVLVAACSNESVVTGSEGTTTTIATTINANTLALGKMIANAKLQESVMNGNTNWTRRSGINSKGFI